jgi:hypothetical protein
MLGTIAILLYARKRGKEKHMNHMLNMLSGGSSVDFYLLAEDNTLLAMITEGQTYDTCLNYINENY